MSATLADFLLARIAEDETVARAATPGPWQRVFHVGAGGDAALVVAEGCGFPAECGDMNRDEDAAHIARHDPARILAECAAKRRIVEAEPERWILPEQAPAPTVDMATPDGMVRVYGKLITELEFRERYMELAPPSQTLLYLAMPYAGHEDFREEWRQ